MDDVTLGGDASCLAKVGTGGIELVILLDPRGNAGESMVDGVRVEEPRRDRWRKVTLDLRKWCFLTVAEFIC